MHTPASEADLRDGNAESGEDLTSDYHDLAVAVQGLGFLESGITDPLNHFSNTLLEFSALLRHKVSPIFLILTRAHLPLSLQDADNNGSLLESSTLAFDIFACQPSRTQVTGPKATRLRGAVGLFVWCYC